MKLCVFVLYLSNIPPVLSCSCFCFRFGINNSATTGKEIIMLRADYADQCLTCQLISQGNWFQKSILPLPMSGTYAQESRHQREGGWAN